jgi:hypothetical protein
MGVMNTSETCGVLEIKVISEPIPIWCGVRGKLANKNSKGPTPLLSIVKEGSTCLTYSLTNLSLPFTSLITIVVT